MTVRSDRRYVRVYDDDLKRDYPAIYADDACLSTWLRLLVIADKMWPTPPEFPRSVKARPLRELVACGLVEVMPEHCYRIRGHDAERTRRRDAASNAAAERWHDKGNAVRNADAMPRRERDENENESTPPPQAGRRANGTNPRANGSNPRALGTSPRQERAREKRGGAESLATILARANAVGSAPKGERE